MKRKRFFTRAGGSLYLAAMLGGMAVAQAPPSAPDLRAAPRLPSGLPPRLHAFAAQVRNILAQRIYRHADFGLELYSLDAKRVLYAYHAQKLFTPASTTKLVTEGAALRLLGPDFRFHTRLVRTGPVRQGVLQGSLVLIAGGDPNLSARVQPGGRLAYENWDHSYDGSRYTRAVPGDPLQILRRLAVRTAAAGIRQIAGGVYVDVSLFPEGRRELGTGTVISPIVVNDNLVDITVSPAAVAGRPAHLSLSPATGYVTLVNHTRTAPVGVVPRLRFSRDLLQPDGSHQVTLSGSFPLGHPPILYAYAVPQPSRFAQFALVATLRAAGISVALPPADQLPAGSRAALGRPSRLIADYTSPPFAQELRVTLKVSQNLHASMVPYWLGALLAHRRRHIVRAGFALERQVLRSARLDLSGASQSDGAGGSNAAFFTPDFMCRYLAWMARQQQFPIFYHALPILGRDGTLFNIETHSPAAGHVRAKTGTYDTFDALNRDLMITGKGLAGYMTTAAGEHLCFAFYANRISLPPGGLNSIERTVGEALGRIATAAYELPPAH